MNPAESRLSATRRMMTALMCEMSVTGFLLVAFVLLPSTAFAQVELDRFYPPVVRIGGETVIQAEGKFSTWPVEAIGDRDDVKLIAGKESGQLTIQVAADAPPGVTWLRLFEGVSASKLVPLLIEPMTGAAEVEPNNKIREATSVELPAVVYGKLAKSEDLDTYRIRLKRGQTFVASVLAHRPLRSPMDAVLQLVDARGHVIFQTDDERGLDPQIVYEAVDDTEIFVRIFAFPEVANSTIGYAGAESFIYTIRMTTDAFVDHVLPLVVSPNDSGATMEPYGWNLPPKSGDLRSGVTKYLASVRYLPSALGWHWQTMSSDHAATVQETGSDSIAAVMSLPCIFSGHIATRGEIDRIRFPVSASVRYEAVVHSRAFGFPLDSTLRVVNLVDGAEVATNDDVANGQYDASVAFTPKVDGEYLLEVSDLVEGHGPRHAYSVVIGTAKSTAELSVADDHFTVNAGASVEVPVSISRRHGFDQQLTVVARGLPEGVVAEPMVSPKDGEASKSVKLKIVADKPAAFQGRFQIIATVSTPEAAPSSETFTAKHSLNEVIAIDNFWLTVVSGKTP